VDEVSFPVSEAVRLVEVTGDWIVSRRSGSEHTRDAYAADLSSWSAWCDARVVPPGLPTSTCTRPGAVR
jgi:hypothetical protein